MIQLTLALKMTTAQVVETSLTVKNNSPIQDYVHPDDQTQPIFEMTPGFKPFKACLYSCVTRLKLHTRRCLFSATCVESSVNAVLIYLVLFYNYQIEKHFSKDFKSFP